MALEPPQMQVPPKQVIYPGVVIEVQPLPDGTVHLVIAAPGEVLVFPMGAEYAQTLGRKLSAPRVVPAPAGVVPINSNGGSR